MRRMIYLATGVISLLAARSWGEDWPQWRHDGTRGAVSAEVLPAKPVVKWSRELGAVEAAWPHEPRLYFDANYHPVVAGKTLFVGSSRNDLLLALDTETGAARWSFYTEGPIRLAPAVADGRVFVGSDDGYLYCLDAASGKLLWKFHGADSLPANERVLGNGRLISTHPVRGGPVVAGGKVYFAAGIWPWLGIFVHCLDAETGKVVWTNDSAGSLWINTSNGHAEGQGYAGPSPQGHLVIAGDKLLVPSGRSLPACLDLATGKLLWFRPNQGRLFVGPTVISAGKYVVCSGATKSTVLDLASGAFLSQGSLGFGPAVTQDTMYFANGSWSLKDAKVEDLDAFGLKSATRVTFPQVSTFRMLTLLFKAGDVLCGGGGGTVSGYNAATGNSAWSVKITGEPVEGLAADGKILVVTKEGGIWCLAAGGGEVKTYALGAGGPGAADGTWGPKAAKAIEMAPVKKGVCVVLGLGSGRLVDEMIRQSAFHVLLLEKDSAKVEAWRKKMDAAGVYGARTTAICGDLESVKLPHYLAAVVTSEEAVGGDGVAKQLMHVVRPYGGIAMLPDASTVAMSNVFARETREGMMVWKRVGGPAGSANWDHEYGDAAKTLFSKDQIKGPFGVLWYGGEVDKANLYIPGWLGGPGVQVVDGRMYIEGNGCLNCADAYTGDMLWKAEFTPPKENLTGPGRDRGYYFVAASDAVYVAFYDTCYKLDIVTGEVKQRFVLPVETGKPGAMWGYFCVQGDLLLAVESRPIDFWAKDAPKDLGKMTLPELTRAVELYDALASVKLTQSSAGKRMAVLEENLAALLNGTGIDSKIPRAQALKEFAKPIGADTYPLAVRTGNALVAMDRRTGQVRWTREMKYGIANEALSVGKDRVFVFDAVADDVATIAEKRGFLQRYEPKVMALDLATGNQIWAAGDGLEPTFQRLVYSPEKDVLVFDGTYRREGRRGSDGSMLWSDKAMSHAKPPVLLHGELVTLLAGSWDLLSGKQTVRASPLTDDISAWDWRTTRGCNFAVASEHMILARSSTAAYLDLDEDAGITNLGGFRSGCRNNLVAACGILSIPRLTGCSCGYPIQASVALVHDDSVEAWTTYGPGAVKGRVKRLGINLGAPGDRKAADGTLWLEYPNRGGASPQVAIKVSPDNVDWFCNHSSRISGGGFGWIAASGAKGVRNVTVTVAAGAKEEAAYTVRLYFAECDAIEAGHRVFDVALQGHDVLKNLDIVKEAGGVHRTIVKEFRDVAVKEALSIDLKPAATSPVKAALLCGIEIVTKEK